MRIWIKTQNDSHKRMPSLKSLISDTEKRSTKIQSREEQHEALKMLSGMYGGKLIELPARPA